MSEAIEQLARECYDATTACGRDAGIRIIADYMRRAVKAENEKLRALLEEATNKDRDYVLACRCARSDEWPCWHERTRAALHEEQEAK